MEKPFQRTWDYSQREALQAIKARLAGEFDDPQLLRLGPLLPGAAEDVSRILRRTEAI